MLSTILAVQSNKRAKLSLIFTKLLSSKLVEIQIRTCVIAAISQN
ncbi:hypothetical protein Vc3S01_1684 [Vibrio campbellii]|nr:hypothetical protein Vc3S01_1684 [Vibrio campbellii]EDL70321.1 hypothetical protein A1Q_1205 [Vibrio campbellii HY01]